MIIGFAVGYITQYVYFIGMPLIQSFLITSLLSSTFLQDQGCDLPIPLVSRHFFIEGDGFCGTFDLEHMENHKKRPLVSSDIIW